MIFGQGINKYNWVSIPLKRFRIGLSDDRDCDSSQEYKEPSPYFLEFWLTIVKWLGIDITDMDTVDAPSVCHIYLYQGIATFFGCTTSTECDQYFEFLNHPDSSLVAGDLQEDHFSDTLGTFSLV